MNPSSEEPSRLLTDEGQWTEPWGGSGNGEPCDKCEGAGETQYECWSCLLAGVRDSCPVCAGQVEWRDRCPVCRGTGEVDGEPRRGVSVFPELEGLYHYMIVKEADLDDCVVVELEASTAEEADFDADQGAMLVIPTEIKGCKPVDVDLAERIEAEVRRHAR
jgi:hypothetical protein